MSMEAFLPDMAELTAPPTTYQAWLNYFAYVRSHPLAHTCFQNLKAGTLSPVNTQLIDSFLCRTDETVKDVLSYRIRNFLSCLDRLFEDFDYDGAEVLAIRFVNDISDCFFFQDLEEIPIHQRMQLADGYETQVQDFWSRFVRELRTDAEETNNFHLEELAYKLARLHINVRGGTIR